MSHEFWLFVLAALFSFVLLPCIEQWTREAPARDRKASER